jgi:RimJ/RimL family protein N-acetyltransferase
MHILVTRRLTLRQPITLDAEDIALWLSNWAVARMLARVPFPYAQTDAEDWIASLAHDPDAMVYTIHRERLIGVVSIEGEGPEPELGYWLAERWHGRGFVTEAARALIGHAFATRDIAAIRSSAFVDNPVSQRVQQKLGFEVCGGGTAWSVPRNEMVSLVKTRLTREAFEGVETALPAAHAA